MYKNTCKKLRIQQSSYGRQKSDKCWWESDKCTTKFNSKFKATGSNFSFYCQYGVVYDMLVWFCVIKNRTYIYSWKKYWGTSSKFSHKMFYKKAYKNIFTISMYVTFCILILITTATVSTSEDLDNDEGMTQPPKCYINFDISVCHSNASQRRSRAQHCNNHIPTCAKHLKVRQLYLFYFPIYRGIQK